MHQRNKSVLTAILLIGVASKATYAADIVSDGDFAAWTLFSVAANPDNEAIITREASGGNPGAHIRITTVIPNFSQGATGVAIFEGFSTTQLLEGLEYQFSIDARNADVVGSAQLLTLLLRQGDSVYQLSLNTVDTPQGSWANFSFDGTLSAQSFGRLHGTGPERPDLSGGTETFVGFSGANGARGRTYDWDNFDLRLGDAPQCSDSLDNDGDGLIDYPNDPGCSAPDDDDETDSGLSQCSDGIDNDSDGLIDFPEDPECDSPNDDDELDKLGFTLEIAGDINAVVPPNLPILKLSNDSSTADIRSFSISIGDADFHFATIAGTYQELVENDNGNDLVISPPNAGTARLDLIQYGLAGFNPGDRFRFQVDIDQDVDPQNVALDFQTVLFGNGESVPNAVLIARFSEPQFLQIAVEEFPMPVAGDGSAESPFVYVFSTSLQGVTEPPIAEAGDNQSIHVGQLVTLDGSGSSDDLTPSENLLYSWTFDSVPEGSFASLVGDSTVKPNFIADLPGTYIVRLSVADSAGLTSASDTVTVSSLNVAPTADAGSELGAVIGNLVTLDGSGSSDGDSDPLTFAWDLIQTPAGSAAFLSDAETVSPTFVPDVPGLYMAELVVNDGFADSTPDQVSITAVTGEAFAEIKVLDAINNVGALPLSSVTTKGNQTALSQHLSQVIEALQQGDLEKALMKLTQAIERTDGCVLRGVPDAGGGGGGTPPPKDYITDCVAQEEVYAALVEARDVLLL